MTNTRPLKIGPVIREIGIFRNYIFPAHHPNQAGLSINVRPYMDPCIMDHDIKFVLRPFSKTGSRFRLVKLCRFEFTYGFDRCAPRFGRRQAREENYPREGMGDKRVLNTYRICSSGSGEMSRAWQSTVM